MCGTVAWLQVKACGDDEQFDLAAWFPSLEYRAGHELASFYIFWYLGSVNSEESRGLLCT